MVPVVIQLQEANLEGIIKPSTTEESIAFQTVGEYRYGNEDCEDELDQESIETAATELISDIADTNRSLNAPQRRNRSQRRRRFLTRQCHRWSRMTFRNVYKALRLRWSRKL